MARFFLIGMLELSGEINEIAGNRENTLIWTSAFAFLLFGQTIDNIRAVKRLFVYLELISAFWFLLIGATFHYDSKNDTSVSKSILPFNIFMISGLQLL